MDFWLDALMEFTRSAKMGRVYTASLGCSSLLEDCPIIVSNSEEKSITVDSMARG